MGAFLVGSCPGEVTRKILTNSADVEMRLVPRELGEAGLGSHAKERDLGGEETGGHERRLHHAALEEALSQRSGEHQLNFKI